MTVSFCDSCSREPANTKKKILVPRTSGLIATCKFLSQCEWWLWLHQCCAGEIEVIRIDFTRIWCKKLFLGEEEALRWDMAAILNVYYLFLDTCVKKKKKTHFLRLFDWLIDWLRSTQSSHLSSRANIHTRFIGDVIPFKSLVFDTITYPCLSLCLSNCSHNYEWMRLNDEEMSLLETTLLLKTLFNYILEDKKQ